MNRSKGKIKLVPSPEFQLRETILNSIGIKYIQIKVSDLDEDSVDISKSIKALFK